ncbi:hypothetical protein QL285_039251 [Trifolium repens]|nr:hypothetical protein QL285_039251 [Trifolium repens]
MSLFFALSSQGRNCSLEVTVQIDSPDSSSSTLMASLISCHLRQWFLCLRTISVNNLFLFFLPVFPESSGQMILPTIDSLLQLSLLQFVPSPVIFFRSFPLRNAVFCLIVASLCDP